MKWLHIFQNDLENAMIFNWKLKLIFFLNIKISGGTTEHRLKQMFHSFLTKLWFNFLFYFFFLISFLDDDEATTSGLTLDDADKRIIFLNKPQPQKYCTNHISTAKYR